MSKISISPITINGDTATTVTLELHYSFTDPFRTYYAYYNAGGKQLFYGSISTPRSVIDNNTEDNIIIETSWQVNNIQYIGSPVPKNASASNAAPQMPLSFIYELYESWVNVSYLTTNQIKGNTLVPGSLINSDSVSASIAGILGITITGNVPTALLTETGDFFITESGDYLILEA